MSTEKKGFFRTLFGGPSEKRTVAVPDMTTSPPTWAEYATSSISIDDALSIPSVGACVRVISTAVSQLDMSVQRNGVEIDSALVARPDSNRSQSSFFKRTVHDLITTGNAYWRLYRNSDGAVVQMEVLSPSGVLIRQTDAGKKFFEVSQFNGQSVTLQNNLPTTNGGQVEHIRLGEFDTHIEGRGPIQIHNAALAAIAEQRSYIERFLAESRRPSGIYSIDANLDDEELTQARTRIMDNRTTGQPDVLDRSVKYTSIAVTPEQAQLVEFRNASDTDILNMFGVPAHLLNKGVEGSSMTYQNIQSANLVFAQFTLEQYLTAIEDAMSNVLPRGQVAQFNVENWLRTATALTQAVINEKETATAA